jgi:hypothetical protein
MKVFFGVFVFLIVLSSCTRPAQKQVPEQAQSAPDSIQVVQKLFKDSKDLVEYEIPVFRGTSKKHGEQKRFYRNGSLYSLIPYKKGVKEGVAYTYYQASEGVEPQVWKAQNYSNNLLNGTCKRYHRDGTLQAEYEYKNGNPAVGLKEYSQSGKPLKQPSLILSANRVATGYYISARLSKKQKNVDYFVGDLIEGKYLPSGLKGLQVKNGLGEIVVDASNKKVTVTAVYHTRYRNKCLLTKTINL